MAISKKSVAKTDSQDIFSVLKNIDSVPRIAKPDADLDKLVSDIYKQAGTHRNRLVWFYIGYTVIFTLIVLGLIIAQTLLRALRDNYKIELVPENVLYIITIGMFGQFIGLLTIVTKKVWEYKSFFDHAKGKLEK